MTKVLILGSTGMLGHQVYFTLKREIDFEVVDISFRNKLTENTIICDVTNFDRLGEIIVKTKPDIIVNCIGVLIKGSLSDPKNAILINSYLPHWLVSKADKIGGKVIHISTDCVFSGKNGGYSEKDLRDADDTYGRSKTLGEFDVSKHLTLRTSIIGPELKRNGEGLFHWFMNQEGEINGFTKAFWGGVTTLELSKVILSAIQQGAEGLINITNGQKISKFELVTLFKEVFEQEIKINPVSGKEVDKSLHSERTDWKYQVPSYRKMVEEMKKGMYQNKALYQGNYPI